jgi:ketosteroid isomerase-like protein
MRDEAEQNGDSAAVGLGARRGRDAEGANVEAVRGAYEAFARGDLEGALASMDEEIVWHQAEGLPHGGTYQGLAAVRANVFDPIEDEWWEGFRADPDEVIGVGDDVVVIGRYRARAKETGRALDIPFAHLWRFRNGRAVRFHQFTDTRGWVEALGHRAEDDG